MTEREGGLNVTRNVLILAGKLIVAVILLLLSVPDIKRKQIPKRKLFISAGSILLCGVSFEVSMMQRGGGALFGILILSLCLLSKESLGLADGCLIFCLGAAFGITRVVLLTFFSMVFAATFSIFLLLQKRLGRKDSIPFLPFLFLSYVAVVFLPL